MARLTAPYKNKKLHRQVKTLCAKKGITINELVNELLEKAVKGKIKIGGKKK